MEVNRDRFRRWGWTLLTGVCVLALGAPLDGDYYFWPRVVSAVFVAGVLAYMVLCSQEPERGERLYRKPILVSFLCAGWFVAGGFFLLSGDPEQPIYVGTLITLAVLAGVMIYGFLLCVQDPVLSHEAEAVTDEVVYAALGGRIPVTASGGERCESPQCPLGLRYVKGEGCDALFTRIVGGERGEHLVEGLAPADAAVVANVLTRLRRWEVMPPACRRAFLRMPHRLQEFLAIGIPCAILVSGVEATTLLPWPPGWVP
jgi:hypothetical protein